jgi:WD40 repeat protein
MKFEIAFATFRRLIVVETICVNTTGPSWMLTGSTDHEVRVWKIAKSKRGSLTVDCTYRLLGHETPVTCVKFGQMEVLSGDVKGRIFIWWMKTGEILRRCQVHSAPVKCMQFDALHIVSGGCDNNVCITDIATGEVHYVLLFCGVLLVLIPLR